MSAASLLQPLLDSPRLIELVAELNRVIAAERERRLKFYEEITEDAHWEFINGQAVMHSPARNRHITVTMRITKLMDAWVNLRQLGQVATEKAFCQFPRNDYEPDIAFFSLPKANLLRPDTLLHPVPDLIVEVLSDSTAKHDHRAVPPPRRMLSAHSQAAEDRPPLLHGHRRLHHARPRRV